ncbi:MAG: plastocyanin/azurin family copper-binding protein [Thermomicrobiales bacterium]
MTFDMRNQVLVEAIARYEAGRMSRRQLLRTMGGLGLGAVGALALGKVASAAPHGGHAALARNQEGGTPPAVATPEVGPRADGTTLWKVLVGGHDMENKLDFQGFFPGEITINAGDSIWFDYGMGGFHTVTFLGGAEPIPLILPDPEATPAAGPPPVIINGQALVPSGGTMVDGMQIVNSGADVFLEGAPIVFDFPTAGTFEYLCLPHGAVMKGTVIVQEAGAELPHDQAGYDALATEQVEALREEGLAEREKYAEAVSTARDDGTTLWEVAAGSGPNQVRVMAFLPEAIEVSVGDTIKFINQSPGEPHTVSFIGEGEAPPEDLLPGQFADGSPKFAINPLTFLPQGGNVWSGTGWVNSGYMGIPEVGLPMEWEVTFDTEGEFIYYCILHGDAEGNRMAATVKVNPKV